MPTEKPQELKGLSASLIKTWENCSWLYHVKYVLRLPDTSNDGAKRGTLCHKVFEVLQDPRHRKHFDLIHDNHDVSASPAVDRWVKIMAKKAGVDSKENLEMIYDMIPVGLKFDFFLEGHERLEKPEFKFDITDPDGRFRIKGFIDQLAFFKDHAVIKDFKSSKSKFAKGELNPNLQNFIYSWAVFHLYKVLAKTRFVFLRFPKSPVQEAANLTELDLAGIEEYFAYVSSQISNWSEQKAKKSYAARSFATKWMCGKEEEGKWCCSYRKPFTYYAIVGPDGKDRKTAFTAEELKPKDDETIEPRQYKGCPRYHG